MTGSGTSLIGYSPQLQLPRGVGKSAGSHRAWAALIQTISMKHTRVLGQLKRESDMQPALALLLLETSQDDADKPTASQLCRTHDARDRRRTMRSPGYERTH